MDGRNILMKIRDLKKSGKKYLRDNRDNIKDSGRNEENNLENVKKY